MYRDVSWMVQADQPILQLLDLGNGLELSPACIARNIGYKRNHTGNRCRLLAEVGLLDREEGGYYSLTAHGRRTARGSMSPDVLESLGEDVE